MAQPSQSWRLFGIAGETVERVATTTSGVLRLEFSDGSTIRCEPDPKYEAWQVVGDPYGLVICSGGGELAMWDNREPPLSSEEAEKVFRDLDALLFREPPASDE
jgi:hypothetical protein